MTEFFFHSRYDKTKLYGKNWSVPNPKAAILIIPGFGDHCERYKYIPSFFNEHNVAVVGIDLRGHGQSSGERGYTPNARAFFDDITSGIEKVHELYSENLPLIMYGDGIGAALLIIYTHQRYVDPLPYQALIACTPSICFPKKPNPIHLAIVRSFAFLTPHTRSSVAGDQYIYTNNQEAIDARKTDQFVHDRWPGRTTCVFCELSLDVEKHVYHLSIPTLVQHGSKAITPMEKVRQWVRKSKGDITFKEWEDFYHELHNDLGRTELFTYTLSWIEAKLHLS